MRTIPRNRYRARIKRMTEFRREAIWQVRNSDFYATHDERQKAIAFIIAQTLPRRQK